MKKLSLLNIVFLLIFAFSSCKKDNSGISNNDLQLAEDDAMTESMYEDVLSEVSENLLSLENNDYQTGGVKSSIDSTIPNITVDNPEINIFPKNIIID